MAKQILRQKMLIRRSEVKNRAQKNQIILEQVIEKTKDSKIIGIYKSFRDEVDTVPIIQALLKLNKVVACPKVNGNEMEFIKITSLNDFETGYFGVDEPIGDTIVQRHQFDAFLIPMVAFNNQGYRLGYGKGFYDRYLTDVNCLKIGLAYEDQRVDIDFQEEYDIACDMILTEKR